MLMTLDGPAVIDAKPDIGLKSRFLPTQPALDASVRKFGVEKLEWCGYPTVKKIEEYVYSFRQNTRK